MANTFVHVYAKAVREALDYFPSWPLSYEPRLGDVGVLEGNVFKRTDSLESLGLGRFETRESGGEEVLEFTSEEGAKVTFGAGAESTVKGLGGRVGVELTREGAVFLRVGEHSLEQIESIDSLGRAILDRFKRGEWERNRVVVTEVVRAKAATILVSGSGGARAHFRVNAELPADVAVARGHLTLEKADGSFAGKMVAQASAPLLRTSGIRRAGVLWLGTDFRSADDDDPEELEFGSLHTSAEIPA